MSGFSARDSVVLGQAGVEHHTSSQFWVRQTPDSWSGALLVQAASASFSGFSAQPKPAEVPQQGRAPFQKEPVFKFGQQPERQSASSGDAAAQQQPNLGSVRVRGFTFGLGSQNVPPAQNTARPFRVRLGRRHSKASVPQPPVASTQDAPAYTQPRPRMSIPVRCSNPFEGSTQGVLCAPVKLRLGMQ